MAISHHQSTLDMQDLETMLKVLQERADWDDCDGDCDLEPPYVECRSCKATRALNDAGDLFREALRLDFRTASELSLKNRSMIKEGVPCGCYFCLQIIDGSVIEEWTDNGETALCPRCTIDAIIPNETDIDNLKSACEEGFYKTEDE